MTSGLVDAYCGTLNVWEDRQKKTGRKIPLNIVVLPAMKQKFAPDPLFFLAGGPGQGAAELAPVQQEPFHRIQMERDIVLVDQRGTGKSNGLDCKPEKGHEDDDSSPEESVKHLHACLNRLQQRADLTKYTTPIAMDDLDDVRQFLGYAKINLYGGSYGTRAAIEYARRYPAHTRAVILDGVAPVAMRLPLYMGRDSQRSLDLLFRDCENDAGCNRRFPNLKARLNNLLTGLDQHPQHIKFTQPRNGQEKELEVKRSTVAGILFAALYSPVTGSLLPLLIEQAEQGNFTGFLALGAARNPEALDIAEGMHFSVVCSEDASRIEPGSIKRESAGTFLGEEASALRIRVCDFWPRGAVESAYFNEPSSDAPSLILSGELDPVTPPAWGQFVAKHWKNARHIVVPATGHGAWAGKCVMNLMAQFLD